MASVQLDQLYTADFEGKSKVDSLEKGLRPQPAQLRLKESKD